MRYTITSNRQTKQRDLVDTYTGSLIEAVDMSDAQACSRLRMRCEEMNAKEAARVDQMPERALYEGHMWDVVGMGSRHGERYFSLACDEYQSEDEVYESEITELFYADPATIPHRRIQPSAALCEQVLKR